MPHHALTTAHWYLGRNRHRVAAVPSRSSTGAHPLWVPELVAWSWPSHVTRGGSAQTPTLGRPTPQNLAHRRPRPTPAVLRPCPAVDRSLGRLRGKHPIPPGQAPLHSRRCGIALRPNKTVPSGCGLEVVGNVIACGPSPATPGSPSKS